MTFSLALRLHFPYSRPCIWNLYSSTLSEHIEGIGEIQNRVCQQNNSVRKTGALRQNGVSTLRFRTKEIDGVCDCMQEHGDPDIACSQVDSGEQEAYTRRINDLEQCGDGIRSG